jgi:hypothetical protein
MLAVVDDEQDLLVPQVGQQQGKRIGRGLVPEVKCGHRSMADQRWVDDFGKLDQPGAAGEATPHLGGEPDRQARLPDPARTNQAHQASR